MATYQRVTSWWPPIAAYILERSCEVCGVDAGAECEFVSPYYVGQRYHLLRAHAGGIHFIGDLQAAPNPTLRVKGVRYDTLTRWPQTSVPVPVPRLPAPPVLTSRLDAEPDRLSGLVLLARRAPALATAGVLAAA